MEAAVVFEAHRRPARIFGLRRKARGAGPRLRAPLPTLTREAPHPDVVVVVRSPTEVSRRPRWACAEPRAPRWGEDEGRKEVLVDLHLRRGMIGEP